ncbi:MAG: FHA domain-containing protein [Acidobacteriota bacterium]|nr:FHA domain-containing protein [Acidobacteriota bacterium]
MTRMVEVVTGPMEGTSFLVVEDQTLTMGRSSSNDITLLYDPWISSAHLNIKNDGDRIFVMDLNSSNGSYVDGDKVEPDRYIAVTEYFVLGSTLCRACEPGPMLTQKPLSVKKEGFDKYREHPLIRAAIKDARHRRSPVLSTLHMLSAILEANDADVGRYLQNLKLNPISIEADIEKYHIFNGKNQWINDFLPYQFRTRQKVECMVTPRVLNLMNRYGVENELKLLPFLQELLRTRYTIVHPLLGITADPPAKKESARERITLNPYDTGGDDLTLPGDFWSDLESMLSRNNIVVLAGDKGTGKTAVLEQCFHSLPKVNIPCFRDKNKRIFDPEMFLVFHEVADLVPYINTIIKALRGESVIAIDHFGTLLHLMHQHHIEDTPMIRCINRRRFPTILAVGTGHLKRVKTVLTEPGILHMDQHVRESNQDILDAFLRDFEEESKRSLSPHAERYLVNMLTRFNFTAAKTFLDFCVDRLRNLNYFYKELTPVSGEQEELSEAFFRYMHDRWCGTLDSTTGKPPRDSELDSLELSLSGVFSDDEMESPGFHDEFPEKLETMLNELLARNFRTALTFPDGTRSLTERGAMGHVQKREELLRQLDLMVTGFRSGFVHWIKLFIKEIDPEVLRNEVGREPRVLWEEYLSRYNALDIRFMRDHFLEISRKIFLRKRRDSKEGGKPPDSLV